MSETSNADRDVAFDLAEHIVRTNFENLSMQDVDVAKKCILDVLGCLLAGSTRPPSEQLAALIKREGGRPEATVLVYGVRAPVRQVVLANATMARALDLDDVHEGKGPTHSSVVPVPVALAFAERRGGVTGKELVTAVTLGQDVMIRMAGACHHVPMSRGRGVSFTFGPFAAATAASKIMGLDASRVVDAFGNTYCQMSGEMQCYHDGALGQRVHQGLAACAGTMGAIMAEIGIGGSRNVLEGKHGYYRLFEGGDYTREELTAGLGTKFWGTTTSFKPFPNCKGVHGPMQGALEIVLEHDLKPEDIEDVAIRCPASIEEEWASVGLFQPEKADPSGDVEAKFSIPWGVGTIIVKRKAWIEDFTIDGIHRIRERVTPIARKVRPIWDADIKRSWDMIGPVVVEIKTKNGRTYIRRVEHVIGSPQSPLTWSDMITRFRDCASFAAKQLPPENVERVIALVKNIEDVRDVAEIARLLS